MSIEFQETFNVCQFFPSGQYEYVRRRVSAEEAFEAFTHYITCVGARIGTTVRVIITDGGDSICAEWIRGIGLTYPTKEMMDEHSKASKT
jgi:hypothetical protein